jgi:hypothetical protein
MCMMYEARDVSEHRTDLEYNPCLRESDCIRVNACGIRGSRGSRGLRAGDWSSRTRNQVIYEDVRVMNCNIMEAEAEVE